MTGSTPQTVICDHGIGCSSDKPGHRMTFMRLRLAHSDKQNWFDARVTGFSGEWAHLEGIFEDRHLDVWNHEHLVVDLDEGDFVAVNTVYNVLAIGESRHSIAFTEVDA